MRRAGCIAVLAALAGPAAAQQAPGHVEAGAGYQHVTAGLGDWRGSYVRAFQPLGAGTVLGGELVVQEAFRDRGVYLAASATQTLGPDWVVSGAAGAGTGEFFFPRIRADAHVGRKWLRGRPLVTTVGAGYVAAQDAHRDRLLMASATYYFRAPVVAEAGAVWTRSSPGGVSSRQQYAAVTAGRRGERYVVARAGWGREAYQLLGAEREISDFSSRGGSLSWREWVGSGWGVILSGELYANPTYERSGVSVGVFRDLRPRGRASAPAAAPAGGGGAGPPAGGGGGSDPAAPGPVPRTPPPH